MLIPVDVASRERCQKLFQTLNKEAVAWCSWKSNRHFEDGVDAETDLDLLFLPRDKERVTRIMRSFGFLLFKPAEHRSYPGVADYISFETATGKVLHIHAHFLLTLGEKNAKSFIFPWNELILNRREPARALDGAYISNPADELVFLLVRDAVKIRLRDTLGGREANRPYGSKGFWSEYEWLKEKVDLESFRNAAASMFEGEILTLLLSAYTKPDRENMDRLKKAADEYGYARGWKRFSRAQTVLTMLKNEGFNKFCRVFEKIGWQQYLIPRRRHLPHQGIVVAFLGSDGAGKSTVAKAIQAGWQHKIDIPLFYMGHGDGQNHIGVWFAKRVLAAGRRVKALIKKGRADGDAPKPHQADDRQVYTPNPLLALASALAKKSLLRKIIRLRNAGYIVICDRWPQSQYPGMNDGPMLHNSLNHANPVIRALSLWEKRQYEAMDRFLKPDLCLKLIASLDVALERKPENAALEDMIAEKIETIKKLVIASDQNDCVINADQKLEDVLQEVRKKIFTQLLAQAHPARGLYRECLGLPGSGKTTLSDFLTGRQAHRAFSEHYKSVFPDGRARLRELAISCVLDGVLYSRIIVLIARYKLWQSKHVLNLLKAPFRKRALLKIPQGVKYVSDQLFLQEIWSISIDLKEKREIQPYHLAPIIKGLYNGLDVQIIYLKSDPAVAAERIETRDGGKSRFDGQSAPEISPQLERAQGHLNRIVKSCYFAGLYVVEVDASRAVEESAKILEDLHA